MFNLPQFYQEPQVFDDNTICFAVFDKLHHFHKGGTVKKHSAVTVIDLFSLNLDLGVLLDEVINASLLINNGIVIQEVSRRLGHSSVKDRKNSLIKHSIDFAFVHDYEDDKGRERQEYILFNKPNNSYSWAEQADDFYKLPENIDWLKKKGYWEEMKQAYISIKNHNVDPDKHSRELFAEAVNDTYNKHFKPSR